MIGRDGGAGPRLSRAIYETLYVRDSHGDKRPRTAWVIPAIKIGTNGDLVEDAAVSGGT